METLSKKPVDPLTGKEYAYSLSSSTREYELAWALEHGSNGETAFWVLGLSAYAATDSAQKLALVRGSYNGYITMTSTWGKDYILALPSLLSSDLSSTDIVNIINGQKLVYNNFSSLPDNYKSIAQTSGNFKYSPPNVVVYEGDINNLSLGQWYGEFETNLLAAYNTGSLIGVSRYKGIKIDTILSSLLGVKMRYYADCNALKATGKANQDGIYVIKPTGSSIPISVYCDMTTNGWGWTLVMKIDGTKPTFNNASAYWLTDNTYNESSCAYDQTEYKSSLFSTLSFSNVRLTFVTNGVSKDVTIPKQSSSLKDIFLWGFSPITTLSRTDWMWLVPWSALQPNCNQGWFNMPLYGGSTIFARIWFTTNNEDDCMSLDSNIGVWLWSRWTFDASAGNNCGCCNCSWLGTQKVPSFVYLFVR